MAERTALVEVGVSGGVVFDAGAVERVRAGVVGFCRDEPLRVDAGGWPGAFLVEPSGSLGGWVVGLTVAVQRWGRDAVWRGRVLEEGPDRLRLAIPWQREGLFIDSLNLALELIAAWAEPVADPVVVAELEGYFRQGLPVVHSGGLLKDSLRFVEAAVRRGIPWEVRPSHIQLGWGARAELMDASFTARTGTLASGLAGNKAKTNQVLGEAGVPVPAARVVADVEQARAVAAEWGWPVVIKPLNKDAGLGVVPDIRTDDRLRLAFQAAADFSPGQVVIEKHVDGDCYRLLVVHGTMLASVRRIRAGIVGDGVRTVAELIDATNSDPRRGATLYRLVLDDDARENVIEQGFDADSVPPPGQAVWLRRTAYTETGGHHVDVGDVIHPDNRALAERVARLVGLDIAGVDLLTTDIARSWREVGGAVCEVNGQPSFQPHWVADPGRDINGEVLDILFGGRPARIPTAAVTGGAAAGAVAVLLHRIWTAAGVLAGVCTARGVVIGEEEIVAGDYSGYAGTRMILREPGVGAGVFEVPAARVAESGHGCDRYDVVGVLDAGGAGGDEVDDPVVARASVAVVLNAEDRGAVALRSRAGTARVVLVARDVVHPGLVGHREAGGAVVFCDAREDGDWVMLADGDGDGPAAPVAMARIGPGVDPGAAMFAAALAWAQGIDTTTIATALTLTD